MRPLGHILQIINYLIDPLLIAAILVVGFTVNWWLAAVFAVLCHWTNRDLGGWFFAWKKENREAFKRNWNKIDP